MDTATLRQRKYDLIQRCGPWTAHAVRLPDNTYTREVTGVQYNLRRVVQIVQDLTRKPLDQARVLDLGSLEGGYAIELACRGANVVGIEGREANIAKAQLVKDALDLQHLEFIQDDVR